MLVVWCCPAVPLVVSSSPGWQAQLSHSSSASHGETGPGMGAELLSPLLSSSEIPQGLPRALAVPAPAAAPAKGHCSGSVATEHLPALLHFFFFFFWFCNGESSHELLWIMRCLQLKGWGKRNPWDSHKCCSLPPSVALDDVLRPFHCDLSMFVRAECLAWGFGFCL